MPDLTVQLLTPPRESEVQAGGVWHFELDIVIVNTGRTELRTYDILLLISDRTADTVQYNRPLFGSSWLYTYKKDLNLPCYNPECTVKVTIDPANSTQESDETNNTAERRDKKI